MILFDIETKPVPVLVDRYTKPFPAFDPSAVKMGNIKDNALRLEKMQAAEASHKAEEASYWANAKERAALNPLTAQILVIGFLVNGRREDFINDGTPDGERIMLRNFWEAFVNPTNHAEAFVFWSGCGANTENFDPDMIIKRSWIMGVKVPASAMDRRGYLGGRLLDAAQHYLMGRREAFCSLSDAGDQLSLFDVKGTTLRRKNKETDPVTGANFHLWWEGKATTIPSPGTAPLTAAEQRALALTYLDNDLLILAGIVDRIL